MRLGYVVVAILLAVFNLLPASITPLERTRVSARTLSVGPGGPGGCANDTGFGSVAWTSPNNATDSDDSYASVNVTDVNNNGSYWLKCTGFGFDIPSQSTILDIRIGIEYHRVVDFCFCGQAGISAWAVKNGTPLGAQTDLSAPITTNVTEFYTGLWGTTWTAADINASNFGAAAQAGEIGFANETIRVDAMTVEVTYQGAPSFDLTGYIWENDDEDQAFGDANDSNSQQAAGNTPITGVHKGERINLRTQLKSTGSLPVDAELGLFYDKNGDNNFIRASYPERMVNGSGGCGSSGWTCTTVHETGSTSGYYSDIVFDNQGTPFVSYTANLSGTVGGSVYLARYVGSGGNCDNSFNGSDAWNCELIAAPSNIFTLTQADVIIWNNAPAVVISFGGGTGGIVVATPVSGGSGGNCDNSFSGSDAWNCTQVMQVNTTGPSYGEAAIGQDGSVYLVGSHTSLNNGFYVAQYIGGSSGNCTSTAWQCTQIGTASTDVAADIVIDNLGKPWVAYYHNTTLAVARYVGSGGNCGGNAWQCTDIDSNVSGSGSASIDLSPGGVPYISYYENSVDELMVAFYDGDGTSSGCNSAAWTCTSVDSSSTDVGSYSSIAFNPAGVPFISYYDNASNDDLMLVQYVGSGGNCDATGGSDAWNCMIIDSTVTSTGLYTSLAFSPSGIPYISYYDETNSALRVAFLNKAGDINIVTPLGAAGGDSITQSHADMTNVTDSINRNDADCTGGGTWVNGKVIGTRGYANLGLDYNECTEVAFTIDTSQAEAGATYRFVIAVADGLRPDRNKWLPPTSISGYPTLTIASDTDLKASKGVEPQGSAACTLSSWMCTIIEGGSSTASYTSLAFNPKGIPYISYYDQANKDLRLAYYVGGGSGVNCASGSSSDWTCVTLDDTSSDIGQYTSISFAADGTSYIAYYDVSNTRLKVAKYVGSGGSGCKAGVTDWACTPVDNTATATGQHASLAIGPDGTPFVAYYDSTAANLNLKVAYFVGSGGNCTSSAWQCMNVDTTGDVGKYTSIAFSPSGTPYISFYDTTNANLRVAQYVAASGNCTGSSQWNCTNVEVTGDVGSYTSLAFSPSGAPYISYIQIGSPIDLVRIAQYVGGASGTGCGVGGSTAWTCTTASILTNEDYFYTSLAFSPSGAPYVSWFDNTAGAITNLKLAAFVSSGGNCGTSNAWSCATISSSGGSYSSLAFSPSGVPYIAHVDSSNGDIKLAKPSMYETKPVTAVLNSVLDGSRNARLGFGQYRLSDGRSPRTNASGLCGSSVAGNMGICALYNDGGLMDSITANANERPYFNFAQRFDSNSILPTASWAGRSDVAPSGAGSAGDIVLQVYNVTSGSWQTVATNSTSTNCNTDNCYLKGIPSGTISDFFDADGGNYWMYWRIYQTENTSGSETLKTDLFQLQFIDKQMRHGAMFENNVRRNFTF